MKFVLLIAADTVRAVRRHRVVLAFVLVSIAGVVLVTGAIDNAAQHAAHMEQAQARAGDDASPDEARIRVLAQRAESFFHGFFAFALAQLGSLLALVLFCTAITGEMKSGTIRVTLAKPVPRGAYLAGKWLGSAAVLAAYAVVSGVAVGAVAAVYGTQNAAVVLGCAWLSLCGSLVTGTVGMAYSLFVRAPVAGVLAWFTSATWVGGIPVLRALLPSYDPFEVVSISFAGASIGAWQLAIATLYAVDLVAILLLIAAARFRQMEIA